MESPGFLRCRSYITRKGKYGFGAAVFSPEKIKRIAPLPADFMTFWENGKRKLDKIPLSVKLTKLDKYCREKFDCYKISFANIDNSRIYGFISIPKQKGKHPAVITVPPAGFGFTSPELRLAARGVIVLRMNVHNFDPGLPVSELRKFYKELNKNKHYGLHGAPKAEKYYFYRAFLGINRAVDWLCARPDWDRKHLVATGTSQGGGSVLIMAGLNKHITAVAAIVPAFCDLMGFRAGRFPGWPRLAYQKDRKKEYDKMIPYFDAANFASFIKCPVLICVGFLDMTCPASSVFAAYNVIKSPKEIIEQPRIGHSQGGKGYSKYISKWIDAHLGLVDKKSELQI
jgi:cephalosporin-C deacetylase-like acetyl esterase